MRIRMTPSLCLVVLSMRLGAAPAAEIGWHASGKGGAIAAGGAGAVEAGLTMLRADGNAADAAAATILALAVTDYGSFAIGGECPLLIYDAKRQEVKVLCGQGTAPRSPEAIEWLYKNGIPPKGGHKAVPVPGAVDLVVTALRVYGTKSFAEAVGPMLKLLDAGGRVWYADLARTLRKLVEAEEKCSGTREEKLTAARDRFYKGDVADELDAWYQREGFLLRKSDLEAHVTRIEDPVSVSYRGFRVYKCGTWTQGPYLLQTLRLLEGFDLRAMGHLSTDAIHVAVEALKLGFADRDRYYADPRFAEVPIVELLSDQYTALRRPLIDPKHASLEQRPGDPWGMRPLLASKGAAAPAGKLRVPDTTTCVVADRFGNVVAATPSCNLLGNQPGPQGVVGGERLRALNTTPGHPNRLESGKRPRITLTPTLVLKDGKPVMAVSVAGGDLQDQTTLNVLLNVIDFGLAPEKAVTAPRYSTSHHEDSFNPTPDRAKAFIKPGGIELQVDIAAETRKALEARGHRVEAAGAPIAHPVMLRIDPASGVVEAAGDPKAGRHAGAIE